MADIAGDLDQHKLHTRFYRGYKEHIIPYGSEIRTERWTRDRPIGKGTFGAVWLERGETGALRAVKQMLKSNTLMNKRELYALTQLKVHPQHFVQLLGWFENEENIYLAMEYMPLGDLSTHIPKGGMSEGDTKTITKQVLEGVKIMHDKRFCHRDLKPANILVVSLAPSIMVKIGDFGISKQEIEGTALRTRVGTTDYIAPEVWILPSRASTYTTPADIWSLGCLTHTIMTGKAPFTKLPTLCQYIQKRSAISFPERRLRKSHASRAAIDFITSLMTPLPENRLTAGQALQHPWLNAEGQGREYERNEANSLEGEDSNEETSDGGISDGGISDGGISDGGISDEEFTGVVSSLGKDPIIQNDLTITPMRLSPENPNLDTQIRYVPGPKSLLQTESLTEAVPQTHSIDEGRPERTKPEDVSVETGIRAVSGASTGMQALVLFDYEACEQNEINLVKGQVIREIDLLDEGWWGGCDARGKHGIFPSNFVELIGENLTIPTTLDGNLGTTRLLKEPERVGSETMDVGAGIEAVSGGIMGRRAFVVFGYEAREDNEIDLVEGQEIRDIDFPDADWWAGRNTAGKHGLFPGNHVQLIEEPLHNHPTQYYAAKGGNQDTTKLLKGPARDSPRAVRSGTVNRGSTGNRALALFNYKAIEDNEINLIEGQEIRDIEFPDDRWWTGCNAAGEHGLFPRNYVELIQENLHNCITLHCAAQHGNIGAAESLIMNGANVMARDKDKWTALHYASRNGHEGVARLLLAKGAEIMAEGRNGDTALHLASWKGHKELVRLLLEKKANIMAKNRKGKTVLHLAAWNGHEDVTRLLLEQGAEFTAEHKGSTPLHFAALNGHERLARLLLDNGADIMAKDNEGCRALHLAIWEGREGVTKLLLEKRADIMVKNNDGSTALHLAAWKGGEELVKLLLEKRANTLTKNKDGCTALHLAASQGHEEVARLLLENGADIMAKNNNGKAAIDEAISKKNVKMVELLTTYIPGSRLKGRLSRLLSTKGRSH